VFNGDEGYRKSFIADVKAEFNLDVDISEKIKPAFTVIPKRWVVERTFAWANNYRKLSKNYEISSAYDENVFMISHLHILLRRY